MFARIVVISNPTGLHAHPATLFVEMAKRFCSDVRVTRGAEAVDAKSVVGLMLLEAVGGTPSTIAAEGVDEVEAVTTLAELVERGFEEEERPGRD